MPRLNASRSRSRSLTARNHYEASPSNPSSHAVPIEINNSSSSGTQTYLAADNVSQNQDLVSMQLFLRAAIQEAQTRWPSVYNRQTHVVRHDGHPGHTWLHPIGCEQFELTTTAQQVSEVARWTPACINPFFIEPSYLSCIAQIVCSPSVALIWNHRLEAWTFTAAAARETVIYRLEYRWQRNRWYPKLKVV